MATIYRHFFITTTLSVKHAVADLGPKFLGHVTWSRHVIGLVIGGPLRDYYVISKEISGGPLIKKPDILS